MRLHQQNNRKTDREADLNSHAIVPNDPKRRVVAEYGPYTIWYDPIVHVPWGLYRIYKDKRYCGAQISWPALSDCEWHDKWGGRYAEESFRDDKKHGWTAVPRGAVVRRKKIQQEPQELLVA